METVNNLASSASRAIWGDPNKSTSNNETNGQEPIAGAVGNVAAGEPYDKGNDPISNNETGGREPIAGKKGDVKAGEPFDKGNLDLTTQDLPTHNKPSSGQYEIGVTRLHDPTSATDSNKPSSSNDTSGAGPTPSVGADPSSAQQPTQKQQGGDRPEDEPAQGSVEHEKILASKKEAEEAGKVDTSGPGPKSLEGKARESGGDIGGGEEAQKESQGEGTGEKWIKSTGVKADGGDFDASRAGAGREADRLLEQKGIHHGPDAGTSKDENTVESEKGSGKEGKEKVSLKDKIKAKLHKH